MNSKTYSTIEITKALQIKKERLRVWIDEGFVGPSIQKGVGPGTKHIFDVYDVYGIALFQRLLDAGFNRTVSGKFTNEFINGEKTEPKRQKAAYITFKVDQTGVIHPEIYSDGNFKLHYETGITVFDDMDVKLMRKALSQIDKLTTKDWRFIFIINVKQLFNEVDAALAKL